MILIYKAELKTDAIYAATLLCCLLGFAFVAVVLYFRHLALRNWHESSLPEHN
jgi:ABC-type nitrate/sulfonate/bicarbonate transport system permease component